MLRVHGGFLFRERPGRTPPGRPGDPKASPQGCPPPSARPKANSTQAWRLGCLATRPPPAAEEGARPGESVLPLSSSVRPRAGCTGAAGGGGRGSSRRAGATAAAPPACGVKERPWHPSPRGVSSTLGSRARPAPTGARHRPR